MNFYERYYNHIKLKIKFEIHLYYAFIISWKTDENIKIQNSVLMAVPIPKEHAMDQQLVDQSIQIALDEAKSVYK